MDSLLDWHLPNLHVAINGLYAAIGDTRRLESAQAASDEARKSELESADDLPFFAKD